MNSFWWAKEDFDWSNIGVDVVNRPTEAMAFNNLAKQADYLVKVGFNMHELQLTPIERELFFLEIKTSKEDFSVKEYPHVYMKDSTVRKVSKLSGKSEVYVMKVLKTVTYKSHLAESFGVDIFAKRESEAERKRRNRLIKWWLNYRKTYRRIDQ